MRNLIVLAAAVSLAGAVVGCTSTGQRDPNLGARIADDVVCFAALTNAGIAVAGNPAVGGAKTTIDVLHAVQAAGDTAARSGVLSACRNTLEHASQDAQGIAAKAKSAAAK